MTNHVEKTLKSHALSLFSIWKVRKTCDFSVCSTSFFIFQCLYNKICVFAEMASFRLSVIRGTFPASPQTSWAVDWMSDSGLTSNHGHVVD